MRYVFIINPAAGKNNLQSEIASAAERYLKNAEGEYKIYTTTYAGEGKEIAKKEAESGAEVRIFACGGEGTVLEVLNGIIGYKNASLGVFPCGSANDFLKFFGAASREKFLDISAQINGEPVLMDVIKANDTYCLNAASVGMDAMVARDMILFKKWPFVNGPMAYNLAIVKTLLKRLGLKIKISVDGESPIEHDCLFASVSNGPCYGGSYKSAPNATPFDNLLDFNLVDTISKLKAPKFLSLYKKGEHDTLDFCHLRKCEKMEFWSEREIPVNLDGEVVETTHMQFSVVKNAISFIVPKGVDVKLPANV